MNKQVISIFALLNSNFPGRWSTRNPTIIRHEAESRASLYIELVIDNRVVIGCSSDNVDFSRDIDVALLEKAVTNAYNNMFAKPPVVFSQEQINFMKQYATKHNITTEEQWNSHIQMWDKNMTKKQLNSDNINGFIAHVSKLMQYGQQAKEMN